MGHPGGRRVEHNRIALAANDILVRVYHQLGQLLWPGEVSLISDHMKCAIRLETSKQVTATLKAKRYEVAFTQQGIEDWEQW